MAGEVLKMLAAVTVPSVSAKLTTEGLIALNSAVEGNQGIDPDEAAEKWINDNGFNQPVKK